MSKAIESMHLYFVAFTILIATVLFHLIPTLSTRLKQFLERVKKLSATYQAVTYKEVPLSNITRRRLSMVKLKTLVLDMDETLMTSIILHGKDEDETCLPTVPYDYRFVLGAEKCEVFVFKRPHVDLFLDLANKWYKIIVFTAATEFYASRVLDLLDNGRNILKERLFRQHCIDIKGMRGKFVSIISEDLANVLIVDNSSIECSLNAENAIRIKSFRIQQNDDALLKLLPFLDALRFTSDIRSVLARNAHQRDFANALINEFDLEYGDSF